MKTDTKEFLTWDDYRATPSEWPYYELIEGELVQSVSPGTRHQEILGNVMMPLREFVRANRLGTVVHGPLGVFLSPHNVLHPDLLFVSQARREILVEEGVHGPPDLVVEIIIPATTERDRTWKRPIYARCGATELWLIESELEQIHRYDLATDAATPVQIVKNDEVLETAVLPGLVIAAKDVFQT